MGRAVVIGLAALAAILVAVLAVTVGRDWVGGLVAQKHDEAPTIMIVSRQVLDATAVSNEALENALSRQKSVTPPAAKAPQGKDASEPSNSEEQTTQINILISTMEDAIGGKVSEAFENSRRFRLVPQAELVDAMNAYAKDNNIPQGGLMALTASMFSARVATATQNDKSTTISQGEQFAHGLTDVARKVGADYTLVVTIGEPSFTQDVIEASGDQPARLVLAAQPIVNCEIFDSKGKFVYRFSQQLDHPVVEQVSGIAGEPIKGEILAAYNKFNDHLAAVAARMVLEWVLDKISPARIMSVSPDLVINRGSNDGVKEGAVYDVEREVGEDIREADSGADLGKRRVPVGSIVIESAQEQISTAKLASGGPLLQSDVVVMASQPSASASASGSGPKPTSLNVAVDHVSMVEGGHMTDDPELGEAVSAALTGDPRVSVLARAELAKLGSERALNERASGDFTLSPDEGLLQSGYLISGECTAHSEHHDNTITMGGVTKTVSSYETTATDCTLRATSMGGRLMAVAETSGGSPSSAAQAAAQALLPKLLSALGMAPPPAPPSAAAPTEGQPAPATPQEPPHRKTHGTSNSGQQSDDQGIHF